MMLFALGTSSSLTGEKTVDVNPVGRMSFGPLGRSCMQTLLFMRAEIFAAGTAQN